MKRAMVEVRGRLAPCAGFHMDLHSHAHPEAWHVPQVASEHLQSSACRLLPVVLCQVPLMCSGTSR
jgi:hypothetical protein